jgi:hypothetical protein
LRDVSLNAFRKGLRKPYELDAPNYQPKEMKILARQAKNQYEYTKTIVAQQTRDLLNTRTPEEFTKGLQSQISDCMTSLQIALDVLAEEQRFAWKWRSQYYKSKKQLDLISKLFSDHQLQSLRLTRKERRMVNGLIQEKNYGLIDGNPRASLVRTSVMERAALEAIEREEQMETILEEDQPERDSVVLQESQSRSLPGSSRVSSSSSMSFTKNSTRKSSIVKIRTPVKTPTSRKSSLRSNPKLPTSMSGSLSKIPKDEANEESEPAAADLEVEMIPS